MIEQLARTTAGLNAAGLAALVTAAGRSPGPGSPFPALGPQPPSTSTPDYRPSSISGQQRPPQLPASLPQYTPTPRQPQQYQRLQSTLPVQYTQQQQAYRGPHMTPQVHMQTQQHAASAARVPHYPAPQSARPSQYVPQQRPYAYPSNGISSLPPKRLASTLSTPGTPQPGQGQAKRPKQLNQAKTGSGTASPTVPQPVILQIEVENAAEIKRRFKAALAADHRAVLTPDLTAFRSIDDAIERLLPYHVYQYPPDDETPGVDVGVPDATALLARTAGLVAELDEVLRTEEGPPIQHATLEELEQTIAEMTADVAKEQPLYLKKEIVVVPSLRYSKIEG
ncbi:hypothetical protein HKX48_002430 [Thoreauomyces humboldtii]|nr:hypothetical protein HKX48_002430 [Thoreauomyces humboldtii]